MTFFCLRNLSKALRSGVPWLTLLCSSTVFASVPATEVFVYADESYPPYSYIEQGQLKGVYPEIFQKIFSQMPGYSVRLVPVAWKRGLLLLEQGRGFALFPPYMRQEERPYMSYSDPVLTEETAVFCLSETAAVRKREQWPDDFAGLRVATNFGFATGGGKFEEMVSYHLQLKDEGPGNRSNILKLLHRRVDCYINDRLSVLWEMDRIYAEFPRLQKTVAITEMGTIRRENAYLGFTNLNPAQFPFKEDFVLQFNRVLRGMRERGEIAEILLRYQRP